MRAGIRLSAMAVVWFGLSFGSLWGLGVEPAEAVRTASGGTACLLSPLVLFAACAALGEAVKAAAAAEKGK